MTQSGIKLLLCNGRNLVNTVNSRRLISYICSNASKSQLLQPVGMADDAPKRSWHGNTPYTIWVPDKPRTKRSVKKNVDEGLDIIRKGIPKWQQEWKDIFASDFRVISEHGDYEYLVKFNGPESMKGWVVSTDGDFDMGKSKATFSMTPSNTALFHGFLNTEPPKDGINRAAGYCNIRCPRKVKSFERAIPYDWSRYTHMYLKVRGDGRNYMLNINMVREYDLHWHDMYQFPLYTRGGPYWQIVKVPFTKFYHSHSARIQDHQEPVDLDRVKYFSIGIMDGVKGRFQLELDSVALVRDESQEQTFEYEMYDIRYI